MKKLIVQVDIHPSKLVGEFHNLSGRTRNEELIAESKKKMERYAKKYGADYELIDEPLDNTKHPWCERFRLFHEEKYDEYDAILYTDIDVIPTNKAPSIWRYANKDCVVVADRHPDNQWIIELWKKHALNAMPDVDIDEFTKYQLNSGVFLFGQNARKKLHEGTDWERMEKWYWKDQMELSYICMNSDIDFKRMPWIWNDDLITKKGYFHHHKGEARKRT